jgi:hypothetical protein
VDITRDDLAMLWTACGRHSDITGLAVEAARSGATIDAQVEPAIGGYAVTLRLVRGEQLVGEVELRVESTGLTEPLRLAMLELHVRGVLVGVDRWRRRAALAERAALEVARAKFDLPLG